MKNFLFFISLLPYIIIAQTGSENYILSTRYKAPTFDGITSSATGAPLTQSDKIIDIMYIDGLGRNSQNVAHLQSGGGKDLYTLITYDEFGRQNIKYLPYQKGSTDMYFDSNSIINVEQFYATPSLLNTGNPNFESTTNPFSKSFFDYSPLNRVIKQSAPGTDWIGNENNDNDHSVKFKYTTNSLDDAVLNYFVNEAKQLSCYGLYDNNMLHKNIVRNENWVSGEKNSTEEYKDSTGRTILIRSFEDGESIDTYYVYSDDKMAFVIPPLAATNITSIETTNIPYKYIQYVPLNELLINFVGGGAATIRIEDSTFKFIVGGSFIGTQINTTARFPINANHPVPDMFVGTLIAGFGRYSVFVENNELKFVDNYPNAGNFTSFNQSLNIGLDSSIFGSVQSSSSIVNQSLVPSLCYQYKYDGANRLVEKKLPGKEWEFIVYDKLDRVVATGPVYAPFEDMDATRKGWLITKYDIFNRVVLTAWKDISTRAALQTEYNNATVFNETSFNETTKSKTTHNPVNNVAFGYTTLALPTAGYHVLTVNYYDDYMYTGAPDIFNVDLDGSNQVYYNNMIKPKGLPTGSWVRILQSSTQNNAEKSYTLYDKKSRPVRQYATNYLGGFTFTDSKLDFVGKTLYTITTHKKEPNAIEYKIKEVFTYTNEDRLLTHTHQILSHTMAPQLLAKNDYDELGQLIKKSVGGNDVSGALSLQKVNYKYNIRGWLTEINDMDALTVGSDPKDLFAFKINYNKVDFPVQGVEALYNGNIAETQWRVDSDNNVRSYGYQYDPLNRLLKANYKKNNFETRSYDETLTYDKNGNIRTLLRNGSADYDDVGMAFPIDNLKYTYSVLNKSNQLIAVVDYENSTEGFNDFNKVGADFVYDSFGNMTKDLNKNITSIKYNHLNLPTQIKFNTDGANEITYLYNAVGVKVGKKVKSTTPGIGVVENKTDYLNGFQYLGGKLQFFPTAEGYVKAGKDDKLSYVYNYTDHLGNVRVSYSDLDKNGILGNETIVSCSEPDPITGSQNCISYFTSSILEENHYYPFGLEHKGYDYSNSQVNYQYKYNGKEYQDELGLNMYDYGARNYDPAIGRWMNIDPLAEMGRRWSPYVYCFNNPMFFIDPDGMWAGPGDEFATPQDAAVDFGKEYNGISIINDVEVSSALYEIKDKNGDTKYSYTVPQGMIDIKDGKNTSNGISPELATLKTPNGEKVVGSLHTHAAEPNDGRNVNQFSAEDKENNRMYARETKDFVAFVGTPGGLLIEHDPDILGDSKKTPPGQNNVNVIRSDMPSDNRAPSNKRFNQVSPNVVPTTMPIINGDPNYQLKTKR